MKLTVSVCLMYVIISAFNSDRVLGRTACLSCIFKNNLDALDLSKLKPVTNTLLNKLHAEGGASYARHKLLRLHKLPQQEPLALRDQNGETMTKWPKQRHDKRYVSYLTLCHFKICNMGRKRTARFNHD